jgi:EAL domain-containing protein (putative c-di-GMP-specific phosphodiesterase class I)/ActR/RegA family two-component response regulator
LNALPATVLVVDDEEMVRAANRRVLTSVGITVLTANDGDEAIGRLDRGERFDLIITDLCMPGRSGIDFLRAVRGRDLDVPVIVLTGNPTLDSAIAAVQYGAFRYLQKPVDVDALCRVAREACAMSRLAVLKRRALELYESEGWLLGDRAGLDSHFDQALDLLWMAFQPIVGWSERAVYGHEALVRSAEPTLMNPGLLFDAAERLGRVQDLGRRIRSRVALHLDESAPKGLVFVNVHAADLSDPDLYDARAPLTSHAAHIVLEITERVSLERVADVRGRIRKLRELGFRIAVDDLGAGYAGLASFSQLEPDVAKLDMSLIRGIDASARKASIVRSMIAVCKRELGTSVVCEGVETELERDTLEALGADLLQGYLFGKPGPGFRSTSIFAPPQSPAAAD